MFQPPVARLVGLQIEMQLIQLVEVHSNLHFMLEYCVALFVCADAGETNEHACVDGCGRALHGRSRIGADPRDQWCYPDESEIGTRVDLAESLHVFTLHRGVLPQYMRWESVCERKKHAP